MHFLWSMCQLWMSPSLSLRNNFKCNGTKLYIYIYIYKTSIFILLSTLLYSSGFHYYLVICTCAWLLLLIMYWLEIRGINSEFYSLFFPSINCPDLLTKPTLIQSSCSCKYPFMLFSLMIKKKVMEEEKVWYCKDTWPCNNNLEFHSFSPSISWYPLLS